MSEKHEVSGAQTTGHVWDDDLADLTNQPPKWWMLGLAASMLFCVVYFLYYPSIPVSTMNTFTKGLGGWTAVKAVRSHGARYPLAGWQRGHHQLPTAVPP